MMTIDDIKVCVVGLGYVGLPLARLASTKYVTVGFDVDPVRVDELGKGHDSTLEVDDCLLKTAVDSGGLRFTNDPEDIRDCNFYIVTVPTPVDESNHPDLHPLLSASAIVGQVLSAGDVVVYESTVYPGVTEEVCLPEVERRSGLQLNVDFFGGYSPERINPGDKEHTVETICKVTSGSTVEAARLIDDFYRSLLKGGTHPVSSIRIAEASKIVENSQRDVNIAFMNELAKIFNAMGIDTGEVLEAAATKWNFLNFKPGLVGGHCISVDPYYLIERAQVYGVFPRVMYSARRLNDSMGAYVAHRLIEQMNLRGIMVRNARILILGFAFKENCPDIRNTKVADIYQTLAPYSSRIHVVDPWVDPRKAFETYNIRIENCVEACGEKIYDAIILAVPHSAFLDLPLRELCPSPGIVFDVKSVLPADYSDLRL